MREIQYSSKFKRDFKLATKQNKDLNKLRVIVDLIVNDQPIPEKYADHQLKGEWSIFRELHIEPLIERGTDTTVDCKSQICSGLYFGLMDASYRTLPPT